MVLLSHHCKHHHHLLSGAVSFGCSFVPPSCFRLIWAEQRRRPTCCRSGHRAHPAWLCGGWYVTGCCWVTFGRPWEQAGLLPRQSSRCDLGGLAKRSLVDTVAGVRAFVTSSVSTMALWQLPASQHLQLGSLSSTRVAAQPTAPVVAVSGASCCPHQAPRKHAAATTTTPANQPHRRMWW
jgi:hypothetical protein